jgi:hypothetical protein
MRKTPETQKQYRDLLGGMLLVPALNIAAFILTFITVITLFSRYNTLSGLASGTTIIFLFVVGYIQVLYLLPFIIFFYNRGRGEVAKGIIISGSILFLISGSSCFMLMGGGLTLLYTILAVYLIAVISTLVLFLLNQ